MHLIAPTADAFLATSCTSVKYVAPATVLGSAPTRAVPLIKPKPRTPLQLSILKRESSKQPNKASVQQLIELMLWLFYWL